MARLCQKALRRSQAGLGLSRALHSSRRDRQQSLARSRRDPRHLPLEGLSGKRRSPEQSHANHDRRVHSPLSPHVLPNGFHRIRNYGLLANGHRADKLALCQSLLGLPSAPRERNEDDDNDPSAPNEEPPPCPCCGGRMRIIETFYGPLSRPYHVRRLDAL